jgi:hypothetical protein
MLQVGLTCDPPVVRTLPSPFAFLFLSATMADGQAQMSRVQRELLELKQSGRVKSQADKLKDCKCFKSICFVGNVSRDHLFASSKDFF